MTTIDFTIFNELSAFPVAESLAEATTWLIGLLDVMKCSTKIGFKRLRTRHDFRQLQLTSVSSLTDFISQMDRDRRVFLYTILQSPYLDESGEDEFLSHNIISLGGEPCNVAEGILNADIVKSLSVSFPSNGRWNTSHITICLEHDVSKERKSGRRGPCGPRPPTPPDVLMRIRRFLSRVATSHTAERD